VAMLCPRLCARLLVEKSTKHLDVFYNIKVKTATSCYLVVLMIEYISTADINSPLSRMAMGELL
jgi:hypothetical protein